MYDFEDIKMPLPANEDEKLRNMYGDYMQLPPVEKRKNHYPYKLEFKDIVLSEGKWCRNTNELELKDINLRCSFYLLIDNKKLVSKLLLGDYKSFLLIYK